MRSESIKIALSARVLRANPEEDEGSVASPRRDKFSILAVPLDLTAQPVSVLVQDPVGRNRALVPMLDFPGIRSIFSWIEPVPEDVIENTLPCIEYLKSA